MSERVDRAVGDVRAGAGDDRLLDTLASWSDDERERLIGALLPDAAGRRWLRGALLEALDPAAADRLAKRLLAWPSDFAQRHRDRTTAAVVRHLSPGELRSQAPFLAGSNAAATLWERLAARDAGQVLDVAREVLERGSTAARETTLYLLALDPYSAARLTATSRLALLEAALADAEDEIRGLAADALADAAPEPLLRARERGVRDTSERVRMATWDAALAVDPERAIDEATELVLDEAAELATRRTALVALGGVLPTAQVAPLLAAMVLHPEPALAEDAANLLWAHHRTPLVAEAAARSPHDAVRAVAARLLHPERGSPAAGGARPGMPANSRDVYQEMLKALEERKDETPLQIPPRAAPPAGAGEGQG